MDHGNTADDLPFLNMKFLHGYASLLAGWWFGCHFLFSHILGMSSSQSTNSYFSEGWPNHQPAGIVILGYLGLIRLPIFDHQLGVNDDLING